MSLTSVELNYLIWRYLQESGFELAAFALEKHANCLAYEHEGNDVASKIEPGCLVNLVQKGILYTMALDKVVSAAEKSERLSLFGALLEDELKREETGDKEQRLLLKSEVNPTEEVNGHADVEMKEAEVNTEAEPVSETMEEEKEEEEQTIQQQQQQQQEAEEEDLEFVTKIIEPKIKFPESLISDWHPITDVFAYGKEDSCAVINAIINDQIAESVTLTHPNVIHGIPPLEGAINAVNIVSWAPLGTIIVTAGTNGELRAWTPDGRLKNISNSTLNKDIASEDIPTMIESLKWSENGQYLLSIDVLKQICLWDGSNLNLIQRIKSPSLLVEETIDACWVGDLKFALSTPKNDIQIYSVTNPNGVAMGVDSVSQIGFLPGHEHNITCLTFNKNTKLLASASDIDYSIKIWNSGSSHDYLELSNEGIAKPHISPIIGLFWLESDANQLLSISMKGDVNVWDGNTGDAVLSSGLFKKENFRFEDSRAEIGGDSLVFSAKLSPNGKWLAIGEDSGIISVWEVPSNLKVPSQSTVHSKLLKCLGVFFFEKPEDTTEVGMCDIAWDSKSAKISVSYKGTDSVIFYWEP